MLHLLIRNFPAHSFILITLLLPLSALAESQCDASNRDCTAIGRLNLSVSLGYGERSNPLDGAAPIPLYVTPQISLYGERFFIDNLDIGYSLFENNNTTFSVIATPAYDRVFFERDDPQNYLLDSASAGFAISELDPNINPARYIAFLNKRLQERERHFTYLGGFEFTHNYNGTQAQLGYGKDLTNIHQGYEVRAAVGIPLYRHAWQFSLSLGATWKSKELVTYYYGDPDYIELEHSVNTFLKLAASRRLSRRWDFRVITHLEQLGKGVRQSPIITDNAVQTFFIGGTYHFN